MSPCICAGRLVVDYPIPTMGLVPKSPAATDDVRLVTIYLPEQYDTTNDRFASIYYLPGMGGDNNSFTIGNTVILDDLIVTHQTVPMIVVHVDPSLPIGLNSSGQYLFQGCWYVNSDLNGAFEDFYTQVMIPYIDANFRTINNPGFRGVCGQSMGGYGALYLGMIHPELFCGFGSESGTSFWIYLSDRATPGNPAFTINSFIQTELFSVTAPFPGKVHPDNGILTFDIFSFSAALSPNLSQSNPYMVANGFYVDLPFLINPDGTPVLTPIGCPCAGADPTSGAPIAFPDSLVLDSAVVARWATKDPFILMNNPVSRLTTITKQAIYLDGGNTELANAVGARILSDQMSSLQIDHEYILYGPPGDHDSCIVQPGCSRNKTNFQMFSAKFAEAGFFPDDIRVKLVGIGTITLAGNAAMNITKPALVGIETLADGSVVNTNIAINIEDNAQLKIGTDSVNGGALQIGDRFIKSSIQGDPALATHQVRSSITIDGSGAQLQVGRQGFLGFGVGANGKVPDQEDFWSITSLANVKDITVTVINGLLTAQETASGFEAGSALVTVGPGVQFTVAVDPNNGLIKGGTNFVCAQDDLLRQPMVEERAGTLMPGGVRNIIDPNPFATDYFYKDLMGSTIFYRNDIDVSLLTSSIALQDNKSLTITGASPTALCNYLEQQEYFSQAAKEGSAGIFNGNGRMGYIFNTGQLDPDGNPIIAITRRSQDELPNICGIVNLKNLANKNGAIGVWLEKINNNSELIRVYDVRPIC